MHANLYARFEHAFPADRAAICLEAAAGRRVTYGELLERTGRLAAVLGAHGVRPGDRVTVQVDKSPEAVCLYLACLKVGAVYMPLNSGYTLPEMDYFLGDAKPQVVVCQPAHAPEIGALASRAGVGSVLTLDAAGGGSLIQEMHASPVADEVAPTGPDDVAAMLYTSGTTGRSKGAMLTHRNLISNVEVLLREWGFTKADVLLHALPIFHVHGLFVALGCAFLSGAKTLFLAGFEADKVLDAMPRASVFMGVPTYYTRLLASPRLTPQAVHQMRLFISGSAPLLPETFRAFRERTGHTILERYGMTETGMITSNPLAGERRVGTVGFPLPNVTLRIADDEGRPMGPGEIGVIELRGPNVLKGYWNNPEKTAAAFRPDGFFITGDVGHVDVDGFVSIVGRASDMIISGGYNVYPKEIEMIIDRMEGVAESAIIGLPHPDFGEAVVAVVRPRPEATTPPAERIIADLKGQLASYKVPKRVLFADDLPRNTMGKVMKAELRKAHASLFQGGPPQAPLDATNSDEGAA